MLADEYTKRLAAYLKIKNNGYYYKTFNSNSKDDLEQNIDAFLRERGLFKGYNVERDIYISVGEGDSELEAIITSLGWISDEMGNTSLNTSLNTSSVESDSVESVESHSDLILNGIKISKSAKSDGIGNIEIVKESISITVKGLPEVKYSFYSSVPIYAVGTNTVETYNNSINGKKIKDNDFWMCIIISKSVNK